MTSILIALLAVVCVQTVSMLIQSRMIGSRDATIENLDRQLTLANTDLYKVSRMYENEQALRQVAEDDSRAAHANLEMLLSDRNQTSILGKHRDEVLTT